MNKLVIYLLLVVFFTIVSGSLSAQSFKIEVIIKDLPGDEIVLGAIKGSKVIPVDTVIPDSGRVVFDIPRDAHTGMYRMVLGQTVYASVMNEPPQKIDFIFNNDSCVFKTDFNHPLDSMQVIYSEENKVWFTFLKKETKMQKQLTNLRKQINYFQTYTDDTSYTASKKREIIKRYNDLQKKRNRFIALQVKKHPDLYASKLIAMYREPFLDGNLPEAKRKQIFRHNFFKWLDFSDTLLLNSNIYTSKVYEYLMAYADRNLDREQQIKQLNKAVDMIIAHTDKVPEISDFIVDYLMNGFEMLGLQEPLLHIAEKYTPAVPCTSEDKSTLQRRIDLQKMRPGTEVPSFKLIDIDGDSISLSDITSKYKLIVFWATWCPHCEQLLPKLYQWYMNRDIDIEVIAISVDSDENMWKGFIRERGYNWINCNAPGKWDGKVTREYNIYATPTMFLVDSDNVLITKPLTFNDLLDAVIGLQ